MRKICSLAAIAAVTFLSAPMPLQAADAAELARINAIVTACERLEHDYAIYRDRGDAEAFANIFTEDGEWGRPTTVLEGREAISRVHRVECRGASGSAHAIPDDDPDHPGR